MAGFASLESDTQRTRRNSDVFPCLYCFGRNFLLTVRLPVFTFRVRVMVIVMVMNPST